MENENESISREEDTTIDSKQVYNVTIGDNNKAALPKRTPNKRQKPPSMDPEEISDAAVIEEEPDTDPFEILEDANGFKATRQYFEAASVYDPKKREPQACEFWEFKDHKFARDGRF